MKKFVTSCAFTALVTLFLFGCKSSTEPATENPVTVVHPGVGTTYTYHSTSRDSSGNVTEESNPTMTVVATNATVGGRTDGIAVYDDTAMDTTYYSIQSNGDVLLFMGDPTGSSDVASWVKFPFSGGAGASLTLVDTTGDIFGLGTPVHMIIKLTTSAAGSESVTAAGKSFSTRKVKQSIVFQTTIAGVTTSTSQDAYVWLAPDLGYFVKREQPSQKDPLTGEKTDSQLDILTSYSLK